MNNLSILKNTLVLNLQLCSSEKFILFCFNIFVHSKTCMVGGNLSVLQIVNFSWDVYKKSEQRYENVWCTPILILHY